MPAELREERWWKLATGEEFVCTLLDAEIREHWSDRAAAFVAVPVLTVRAEDGREGEFWAWHKVAQTRLRRLKPKRGEKLSITMLGERPGKDYIDYRIAVPDRPADDSLSDVWGELSHPTSTPAAPAQTQAPAEPDVPIDTEGLPGGDEIPW
jgi:hypothetical protein